VGRSWEGVKQISDRAPSDATFSFVAQILSRGVFLLPSSSSSAFESRQPTEYSLKASFIASVSFGRRRALQGLVAALLSAGLPRGARGQQTAALTPIVRISRGSFPPEKYEAIKVRLDASETTLVPAIRQLSGCLHYFAAIDRDSSSMVNVSVWRSLADAQQMQTFGPMLALAEAFVREGVRFERPIINYEALWAVG
jgi:quinol monooxygenase YgiN